MKSKDAKVIRTKRFDTQKGDDVRVPVRWPGDRGRRSEDRPFREHSPLFLARTVVSMVAWERTRPWSLMALDVSCAFLYATVHGRSTSSSRRGSAGSRREVRGSLEESLVWDTRRTATLAEGTGEHAERSWVQR